MPTFTAAVSAEERARLREELLGRVWQPSAGARTGEGDGLAEELAALERAGGWEPPVEDEEDWPASDPAWNDWLAEPEGGGLPGGEDGWLAGLPTELHEEYFASTRGPVVPEVFKAGFWCRGPGEGGFGFAAGGIGDKIPPGPALAGLVNGVWQDGLGRVSDDELIGVLRAARRLTSWAQALELAATGDLMRRRFAEEEAGDTDAALHATDEVAAALALTGRAADRLVTLSLDVARLPGTAAALAAGEIDLPRAWVIAEETSQVGPEHRAAVEQQILARAARQTTTLLRRLARRVVLKTDPDAVRRRKEQAKRDARVEHWDEHAGTAALAGRDLPAPEALAADRNLTDLARQLKAAGAAGTLDQLRAAVYLALLSGQPVRAILAALTPARDEQDAPAPDDSVGPDVTGPTGPAQNPGPAGLGLPTPSLGGGTVHLTMPLAAWLGLSEAPGEVAGYGPLDTEDTRRLATLLTARAATRWCLTLTDRNGHPVAHGCARPHRPRRTRAGPDSIGPGAIRQGATGHTSQGAAGQALTFTITNLQAGTCAHPRESSGYEPPPGLRHLVEVRHATCTFPGCLRAAQRCDLDHTLAYQQGGKTCECNLGPLCRRHHRAKQAHGWRLTQDQPGVLTWTTPSGRTHVVQPTTYED